MKRSTKVGVCVEAAVAVVTMAVALLTLFRSDWLESAFGIDPDQHSGMIEWLFALALLTASLFFAVNSYRGARVLQRIGRGALTSGPSDETAR